ncbi:hypothetical protein PAXRUDRAFT_826891 [Paxillus rubicundulus Ve08.2h10]|uniref:Uncharacterized protein n=1 Tax=Paxillus rubicundulus Ve08.2h10 TaxID=930991 RepID=A0A0D0E3P2_9AGAM|nr:hypothetical protein PAXRUDRAFT_826891 [Paxillus rubicundulus Ve08.2h10]
MTDTEDWWTAGSLDTYFFFFSAGRLWVPRGANWIAKSLSGGLCDPLHQLATSLDGPMVLPSETASLALTLDDSLAVQCRVVIGRHTDEKGRSLSYTKRVCSMSAWALGLSMCPFKYRHRPKFLYR